eukprot:15335037-Ditylum_brightwellii.AAC.1
MYMKNQQQMEVETFPKEPKYETMNDQYRNMLMIKYGLSSRNLGLCQGEAKRAKLASDMKMWCICKYVHNKLILTDMMAANFVTNDAAKAMRYCSTLFVHLTLGHEPTESRPMCPSRVGHGLLCHAEINFWGSLDSSINTILPSHHYGQIAMILSR